MCYLIKQLNNVGSAACSDIFVLINLVELFPFKSVYFICHICVVIDHQTMPDYNMMLSSFHWCSPYKQLLESNIAEDFTFIGLSKMICDQNGLIFCILSYVTSVVWTIERYYKKKIRFSIVILIAYRYFRFLHRLI